MKSARPLISSRELPGIGLQRLVGSDCYEFLYVLQGRPYLFPVGFNLGDITPLEAFGDDDIIVLTEQPCHLIQGRVRCYRFYQNYPRIGADGSSLASRLEVTPRVLAGIVESRFLGGVLDGGNPVFPRC